jgi:hypothetical protein
MAEEKPPTCVIPGDVLSDYVFQSASGGSQEEVDSEDLLPRKIQSVLQDIIDINKEIEKVDGEKQQAQERFTERKAALEKGLANIQQIVARFSRAS